MTAYEVRVTWDGVAVPGLRAVGPLRSSVDVVTLHDGLLGRVTTVPGRPDTGELTLQREVGDDLSFDLWARGPQLRKEVELALVPTADAGGAMTVRYLLHGCWVSGYAVEADVESGVAVETITVAVDAWQRVTAAVPELAADLGLRLQRPVMRVDLGRLVSETLEETGRRTDELLQEAERSGAVLLFDEGDALFTRRTDVADAHDRYAEQPLDTVVDRLARYPYPVLVVPPT